MKSNYFAAVMIASLMAGSALAAPPDRPALPSDAVPYVVDHPGRTNSLIDMRFLLDGPAGKYGFLSVKDGHFRFPNGQRFKCWGVNITGWELGSALLPPHREAEIYAESLARLGVNCVRLHFLDMRKDQRVIDGDGGKGTVPPITHTPSGLIDSRYDDSRHFDPDQVDRLHYLFAQFKQRGIYVDFNLNVGRTWKAGDGVPDHDLIGVAKGVTYFGPELVALQKEYARRLLGLRNPYTGMRYADDPAVAIVEIVNENSLLEFWQRGWLRGERAPGGANLQLDLTPHYARILTDRYNDWLAQNRKPAELVHLRTLAGIGPGPAIPFLRRGDFRDAPKERFRAEIEFLTSVEIDFQQDMARFLREEVGVKSIIMPTADHTYFIAGQPMMRSSAKFDVMDSHVYWQHPAIYGHRSDPMVNRPDLSIPVKLARTAMTGRAFTVSEVNHPYPSDYGAEMIPTLAAYAALQDWDGIFFYTFEAKLLDKATPVIGDHFDITQDPVKIAQLPVGAMLFLRGDVAPARTVVQRNYSTDQIDEAARMPRALQPYFTPGFPMTLPLVHGSRAGCLDCASVPAPSMPLANPILSDTGELSWRVEPQGGVISVDTPCSQALVGFARAAGTATTHLSADIGNDFAAITLSALDGKPLRTADRMLLTATAKAGNSGQAWNDRHAMLDIWGTAPTWIEPVRGWLTLRDLDGALAVTATPLDGAGKPNGPDIRARMLENGWEIPVGTPAATSYLVRIAR
ncbi:hypothetical protein [Sphingobium sp. WCS2017Hpa-17]|uniref:hypothetical protein n=1 Tax=Sphingobium sp. WCS2017Hpa-17 TaxID=3073638 RepID=UPI002888FA42|nr:hypothetical protein [Sphingobium sp. WCS2017Hpa-17]